jgi:nucleoside-diphosphate-sugar epimerase
VSLKVLITGGAGYAGAILTQQLLSEDLDIRVLDSLVFGSRGLLGVYGHPNFEFIKGDIRDENIVRRSMEHVDAVFHLAAIVGEPLCKIVPEAAFQINQEAVSRMLKVAKDMGVKRFIFASSCSAYGTSDANKYADEDCALNPVSLYAETKVESEKMVMNANVGDFVTCVLRFATIYGVSPRMRLDLILHEFIRDAYVQKNLLIFGPDHWRPLVHIRDAAALYTKILTADPTAIGGQVFNVGNTEENYTKLALAKMVKERLPDTKIEVVQGKADIRNYRVCFDRAKEILGFQTRKTVRDGIEELVGALERGVLDPTDGEFTNLSTQTQQIRPF